MKTMHPKVEVLTSNHQDNKAERLPTVQPWQMRLGQIGFQTVGRIFPNLMAKQAYKIFATPRWRAKHTRSDAIIDAAKVLDFPFREFNVKLYEWGDVGNPIILLAHGWESRGTALRMLVNPLLAKGFRIIAFDAVGHGDSSGKYNNLSTNAHTIAAIIQHYGGIYGAIGHSFGCSSTVFAQQHVDNSIEIEKLVFLAVPHKTEKIVEHYFNAFKVPQGVRQGFYAKMEAISGLKISEIDVAKAYNQVKVGQLFLIHDRFDDVTSLEAAENVVHQWHNARLLITEGYGHFRLAKNPDVVKRIMAFIQDPV